MKRFHVHLRVKNLAESISFYNALFSSVPSVQKTDYAKWMLEDPRVNFAISASAGETGLEHLGIQAESQEELNEVYGRLQEAKGTVRAEGQTVCCYAQSEKSWMADPQGVEWEAFYTFGESTVYSQPEQACCS
jgi:catechol-2,3-dioxygenase